MANECSYFCRVCGKNEKSVRQFVNAMKYEDFDNGYFMCRIFSCFVEDEIEKDDEGIFSVSFSGSCAWSVRESMIDKEYGGWRGIQYGDPVFEVWRERYSGKIQYANIGVTAPMLCKILGCGFEVWSSEPDMGFQEHYAINSEGKTIVAEYADWKQGYDEDENGNWIDYNEEKDEGGLPNYGDFMDASDLIIVKEED